MPRTTPFTALLRSLAASTSTIRTATTSASHHVRSITSLVTSSSMLRPSLLPLATAPSASATLIPSSTNAFSPILQQLRFGSYGAEYQPSQRKRKRKHGYLARQRGGKDGLAMLRRRRKHGRRTLSH